MAFLEDLLLRENEENGSIRDFEVCAISTSFPLNIRSVDKIFPGLTFGDFAVLQGTSVVSLASLLCIQAQLPTQFGGLKSNVIFIEGGYTFRLYQIAQLAKIHQLDPRKVLSNIYISRAFTAYQATSMILEQRNLSWRNINI